MRDDYCSYLVKFQHSEERLLWHLHGAYLFHSFFAGLLFLKEFALTAHVTAVTLGSNVFAHLLRWQPGWQYRTADVG